MSFDFEWQRAGTPYTGRHRRGRLPLRAARARGYLRRIRTGRDPASATEARPAHRGLPAVYEQQRTVGR